MNTIEGFILVWKSLSKLDYKIISTAEEMFLKVGLIKVEMKDIARAVGISRSTLYRHFENKLDIAFILAKQYMAELDAPAVSFPPKMSGYEKFRIFIRALVQKMLEEIDKVSFLSEFDILYNAKTPLSERERDYETYIHSHRSPLLFFYAKGIEDGSILDDGQGEVVPRAIHNTCFAMIQRIGVRESIYLREHHIGNEMIHKAIELQLESIRKTENKK